MSTADLEQEISRIDEEIAELQASLSEITAVESGITRPGSQQRDSGYSGHHEHQARTPAGARFTKGLTTTTRIFS